MAWFAERQARRRRRIESGEQPCRRRDAGEKATLASAGVSAARRRGASKNGAARQWQGEVPCHGSRARGRRHPIGSEQALRVRRRARDEPDRSSPRHSAVPASDRSVRGRSRRHPRERRGSSGAGSVRKDRFGEGPEGAPRSEPVARAAPPAADRAGRREWKEGRARRRRCRLAEWLDRSTGKERAPVESSQQATTGTSSRRAPRRESREGGMRRWEPAAKILPEPPPERAFN